MTSRPKRPFSVTLLTVLVFSFSVLYWLRFYEAIVFWSALKMRLSFPSPVYLVLTGLIWGVVGLIITWGLWIGSTWAPRATWISTTLFAINYWLDRLIIADRGTWVHRTVFMIGFWIIVFIIIAWSLTREESRLYFKST